MTDHELDDLRAEQRWIYKASRRTCAECGDTGGFHNDGCPAAPDIEDESEADDDS